MWDMFNGCNKLTNLIIPNFDTSKVTDMQSMFSGCKNLLSLNLNHFITTKVQYMNEMFQDCEKLKQLNMSQLISDSIGTYNVSNVLWMYKFGIFKFISFN